MCSGLLLSEVHPASTVLWIAFLSSSVAFTFAILTPVFQTIFRNWALGPKVRLSFDETCEISVRHAENWTDQYIRLRVDNHGRGTALRCRAWLTKVEAIGDVHRFATIYSDCIPLIWSFDPKTEYVDVPPGITRHVDVAKFSERHKGMFPQFRGADGEAMIPVQYQDLFSQAGCLSLTIMLTSQDFPPTLSRIAVTFSHRGVTAVADS